MAGADDAMTFVKTVDFWLLALFVCVSGVALKTLEANLPMLSSSTDADLGQVLNLLIPYVSITTVQFNAQVTFQAGQIAGLVIYPAAGEAMVNQVKNCSRR